MSIGETGSGKSTLGRILVGLARPSDGSFCTGRLIADLRGPSWREYRRSVQMVFQNPTSSFNPMLTVGASIRDALRFSPLPGASTSDNAALLLEQVELSPQLADRYPDEVSGGELQRASIARALATEPALTPGRASVGFGRVDLPPTLSSICCVAFSESVAWRT